MPRLRKSIVSSSRSLRPCLASWVTAVFCLVSDVRSGSSSCRFPFCSMYLYSVCSWNQEMSECKCSAGELNAFACTEHLHCWSRVRSCRTLPPLRFWSAFRSAVETDIRGNKKCYLFYICQGHCWFVHTSISITHGICKLHWPWRHTECWRPGSVCPQAHRCGAGWPSTSSCGSGRYYSSFPAITNTPLTLSGAITVNTNSTTIQWAPQWIMTVVSGCPLILSDSHIVKSFHTKSRAVERIRNRIYEGWTRGQTQGWLGTWGIQRELWLETDSTGMNVDRKWIVLEGREGTGHSHA